MRVSFFQGTVTQSYPDSRRFDTISLCPGSGSCTQNQARAEAREVLCQCFAICFICS